MDRRGSVPAGYRDCRANIGRARAQCEGLQCAELRWIASPVAFEDGSVRLGNFAWIAGYGEETVFGEELASTNVADARRTATLRMQNLRSFIAFDQWITNRAAHATCIRLSNLSASIFVAHVSVNLRMATRFYTLTYRLARNAPSLWCSATH